MIPPWMSRHRRAQPQGEETLTALRQLATATIAKAKRADESIDRYIEEEAHRGTSPA